MIKKLCISLKQGRFLCLIDDCILSKNLSPRHLQKTLCNMKNYLLTKEKANYMTVLLSVKELVKNLTRSWMGRPVMVLW